jgi:tRNA U34 5-carboxymethylaminomethyl modifying GTPase MnmE/TrmE
MTKTLEREVSRKVRQKREELTAIRQEVEDLIDYLDVLQARVRDSGKARLNQEQVKKRYGAG